MKIIESFLLIIWMLLTLALAVSLVGLTVILCSNTDDESAWMLIGLNLLEHILK